MPISVEEKYLSRPTKDSGQGEAAQELLSIQRHFIVKGTDDELLAAQAVRQQAPTEHNGLDRGEISLEPLGPWHWEATVEYRAPDEELEAGESSYSFDTGGGTQHISQSLKTVGSYAKNYSPIGYGGAIGVTDDSVEGVDITVPVYRFSETHIIADERVTDGYKGSLFRLTGKTNAEEWKGFAAGEVLFLGASGSKRGKGDWEITFNFAASPNETGLKVGEGTDWEIADIAKKGWEYLWIRYVSREVGEGANRRMGQVPEEVYIEQVYKAGDFGELEPPEVEPEPEPEPPEE